MAGPAYSIADPVGGEASDYRRTAIELRRLLADGADRIHELAKRKEDSVFR
jgi:hypothetical protein